MPNILPNNVYHVMPSNDLREHITHEGCKCQPAKSTDGLLVIHNSWDGREFYEQDAERLWNDAEQFLTK